MNPVLKFFFFNKVFVGPVNNACDSLENQKNTSLPTQDPQRMSSKKKKKNPKCRCWPLLAVSKWYQVLVFFLSKKIRPKLANIFESKGN